MEDVLPRRQEWSKGLFAVFVLTTRRWFGKFLPVP